MVKNINEILSELEYHSKNGIIDFTKKEQVDKLEELLRRNGVSNSNQISEKAALYFLQLTEKQVYDTKREKELQNILKQKIKNPETGKNIQISTALGYGKKHPVYQPAMARLTAKNFSEKDIEMVDAEPEDEETPEKPKVKGSSINVSGAETRLGKSDKSAGEPLVKDLNKALANISDAKNKIQKVAVDNGKMSQKDLNSVIDVATKIVKGINLNEKDKEVADTYIRIKDKKEDTSIYILFPPFNTQNHAKVKMGNLDRLLAYGKTNGIKTISQGSSGGADASADKQKLPKKAMAGANINKKTVDTTIRGDENSVTFGKTGTKIEKFPEYSKEEQSQLADKLTKSGMNPEKAAKLVERLATESERHNKVIDFFKKSPSVKTLDFGAEPTTDEGRRTIIKNSKQQSIAQFEKFFKKAGDGTMTSEEKKVLDIFESIKSPYDNPNWNKLSEAQKKEERDRYENEMESLLGTMMKTPSFRQAVPDFAEVIRYNIYLGHGLEAYLPADSTFQISDIIVFTPKEKIGKKDVAKKLSESANMIIESLVFTGGVSEKVLGGGAPSGEERIRQSVFKNGDGSFNTQERLLDNMQVYNFTFRHKDKFLENNPRKREDWSKLSLEEQAKLLRTWEDEMNEMPSDDEFNSVQNQLDKTLTDAAKAGIITEEDIQNIKDIGKHQGNLLVNKAIAKGAGNCLNKNNLKKYHTMLRMWAMMGAMCEKINNNDLKYTLFKNNREMFDSKGNFIENEVIDGVDIKPGMKWKYDPGMDVTSSVPSIEKHKAVKNGPRGCKFLAMNNPNSASIVPIK